MTTLKEKIVNLQAYKMLLGEDTVYVKREDILNLLEQDPRWIPVSERLPEEDGEYLVTIYDEDENYKYMDIAELADGIWQYKDYIKVLAWMPAPESYIKSEVEE